jgi:hypothetical protein
MRVGAIFTLGAALGVIVGIGIGSLLPWSTDQPQQYSSPYNVKIAVASEITRVPYTEEQKRNPNIRNIIDQCEKRELENCDTNSVTPEFSKEIFDRSTDETVYTFIELSGLEGGSQILTKWRLIDPSNNVHQTFSLPLSAPQGFSLTDSLDVQFFWSPQDRENWPLGQWRVEILVNDEQVGSRAFEVVDGIEN